MRSLGRSLSGQSTLHASPDLSLANLKPWVLPQKLAQVRKTLWRWILWISSWTDTGKRIARRLWWPTSFWRWCIQAEGFVVDVLLFVFEQVMLQRIVFFLRWLFLADNWFFQDHTSLFAGYGLRPGGLVDFQGVFSTAKKAIGKWPEKIGWKPLASSKSTREGPSFSKAHMVSGLLRP